MLGTCAFTTEGLGITPNAQLGLIQTTDTGEEAATFANWFEANWNVLKPTENRGDAFTARLTEAASQRAPSLVYFKILFHAVQGPRRRAGRGAHRQIGHRHPQHGCLEEALQVPARRRRRRDRQARTASAAASSPTASASERRSRRSRSSSTTSCATIACSCLCPKRLRDNWTLYKANDRRNFLASDRFNYDVLNHTDLSRDGGIVRRHRPRARQLGQLRPRRHRRVAQLPQQDDATTGRRDPLRPPDAQDHQGGRQDPRADALGHAGQQPPGRPAATRSPSSPRATTRPCSTTASPASTAPRAWRRSSSTAGSTWKTPSARPRG